MKLNLLSQYNENNSKDENSASLTNMYFEEDKNGGKYSVIALPTPGLSLLSSSTDAQVRGSIEHIGITYTVIDDTFYSVASDGTKTSIGTLDTSSGFVQIATIPAQIGIIDGTYLYIYDLNSTTFAKVTDADVPTNPSAITAQDGFFLISSDDSANVYGSDPSDGTSWNALSFATKEGEGDKVMGLFSNKELVYVLGERQSVVWYNSGAATFSFEPVGLGSFFHYGLAARNTMARTQDTLIFLAQSASGGYQVVRMNQYTPESISSRAIEYQLNKATNISNAFAFTYSYGSHDFYVLSLPDDDLTFQYDFSTGLWNKLSSKVTSEQTIFRISCVVYCYNKLIAGDYFTGNLYTLESDVYTENSTAIYREIISPPGYVDGMKVFLDRVQLDLETGVGSNSTITLDVSKNTGRSYDTTYTGTIPDTGERLYFNRLGMTPNAFVLKLSTQTTNKFIVLGAQAILRKGIH